MDTTFQQCLLSPAVYSGHTSHLSYLRILLNNKIFHLIIVMPEKIAVKIIYVIAAH